jgi:DNA-binding MarR family transcriptional regulator
MADGKRGRRIAEPVQAIGQIDMAELNATVGFTLKRAQIAVSGEIHEIFAEFGITAVQFSVLTVVTNNPGIAQGDLAAALEVERPRMVPVLDKLENRGLTVRRQDARDGRSRRIHLTDDGAALLTELRRRFGRMEKRLTSALGGQQREQLLAALQVLIELPR